MLANPGEIVAGRFRVVRALAPRTLAPQRFEVVQLADDQRFELCVVDTFYNDRPGDCAPVLAAMRAIDHPGVVRVLDGGAMAGRRAFWLLSAADGGETLETVAARDGGLDAAVVIACARQIAAAAGAVHQAGMTSSMYGDNVLVSVPRPGEIQVRLLHPTSHGIGLAPGHRFDSNYAELMFDPSPTTPTRRDEVDMLGCLVRLMLTGDHRGKGSRTARFEPWLARATAQKPDFPDVQTAVLALPDLA